MQHLSVQFNCSVVSDSASPRTAAPQEARLPCLSSTLKACSKSCLLNWWCHPNIILCHPLLLLPSIFPSMRVFYSKSVLHIRWPKYWSFSFGISPSNEYSGLISFRKSLSLFPHLFAMKWWDQMPWSLFFWMLSFKPAFSLSSSVILSKK